MALPWGTIRADALILNGDVVDTSLVTAPPNRVVSGKTRSSSNQPQFIVPNGSALSLVIDGTPTNLVVNINGSAVTVNTDITRSSLTAAPSSQNTALVNDTDAADQYTTRIWGEPEAYKDTITIDTVGTNITALVGKYAAFMIDNGSETEYFLAFVESATTLTKCKRGYFYDSSGNPKNRIVFSNNDTITLLKIGFLFVENDGLTTDVTYTVPAWSFEAPSSPATGDYWYDLGNNLWKRYDGASFQIINRTLIGIFASNTTACIAARCQDFYAGYTDLNALQLEKQSTEIVRAAHMNQKVNVAGNTFTFEESFPQWNITTDLASSSDMYSATEQASRGYYCYLKDDGNTVISDIHPYWRADLYGAYHPHNPWRCVGAFYNDSSSDIQSACGLIANGQNLRIRTGNGLGSTATGIRRYSNADYLDSGFVGYEDSASDGTSLNFLLPGNFNLNLSDQSSSTSEIGFTKNVTSTESTQAISSVDISRIIAITGMSTLKSSISVTHRFKIGDVLRPHADANAAGTTFAYSQMNAVKLGVF